MSSMPPKTWLEQLGTRNDLVTNKPQMPSPKSPREPSKPLNRKSLKRANNCKMPNWPNNLKT